MAIKHPAYRPFKTFKGDTLAYLRTNFVDRMAYYQNKPLSVLLKDVEINIHTFTPIQPYFPPEDDSPYGVYLRFEDEIAYYNKKKMKKISHTLVVLIKDTIDMEKIRPMLRRNKSRWTKEIKAFYEDKIVKEIGMIRHHTAEPK